MTKSNVIKILKHEHKYLSEKYGVKKIAIFGSFAKNLATKKSDVDIYVEFKKSPGFEFIHMCDYLEKKLGRKADVLTKAGIRNIRIKRIADEIKRDIVYV